MTHENRFQRRTRTYADTSVPPRHPVPSETETIVTPGAFSGGDAEVAADLSASTHPLTLLDGHQGQSELH